MRFHSTAPVRRGKRDRRLVVAIAVLGGLGVTSACNRKVTAAECSEMLDRYVDMAIEADPELAKLPPAEKAAAKEMKKAVKRGEKSYAKVQAQCESEIHKKEYDCALSAKTPNEWEACIE